jgi:NAD(P)-dependent dehydrogenase (short-subunit alcohol dehydrogenase family)
MNQAGKSALITGAASGIGAATAKLFANNGWQVGIADVDEAAAIQLAAEINAEIDATLGVPLHLDVRRPEEWDRALSSFAAHTNGKLDLLVNNAGRFAVGALVDMDGSDIQPMVDVNLMGAIHGARAAHPLLRATEGAGVVNIASFLAVTGTGQGAVYSATKAAVRNLTEGLAAEFRYDGIWVSDVLPGFAATGFFEGDERREAFAAALAAAGVKFIGPEKVAAAVWDATRRYRLHRTVGRQARLLTLVQRVSPNLAASAVRRFSKRLMKAGF